ncbi:bacteriophage capsid protein [Acetobacter nitrogenifigens DSM 23921 = NBRC 105050]|uniref:Phage portal protein n=1 Tax=Acetobacter nitrogenifigens DSM 23921 = NBRC 105050 TaxID=1120919 RepID=A0A511X5C9_9PROT|nr:phage portal protein [Acetobacter nitrogenifigens]GBQ92120.1 bacteriophage capsid protein [Acetobacter nitrogenifigens DSM 23921 = NBRC 105050]GEN58120.1 phage portal protein [Acetobacter nitrogenifigens DSM 23921 = NBRC 105050]
MKAPRLIAKMWNAIADAGNSPSLPPTALPGFMGGMGGPFAYDAANIFSQEGSDWNPLLRSPDNEINMHRDRMVARARDLYHNDGWARGAITRISDNVVGAQWRLVAKPDYRALNQRYGKGFDSVWADEFRRVVEAEWRTWSDDPLFLCDQEQAMSVQQMLRLAFMHRIKDGESLIRLFFDEDRIAMGALYAMTMQVVHPDRLSNPYQQQDTHFLRGGVELNDDGAHIAYHLRRAHQFDYFDAVESVEWERIPRYTPWGRPVLIHSYDRDDAGQHRGLSVFAPIMNRFRMLSRYDQAELQQALIQTCFATFFESPYDAEDAMTDGEGGEGSQYQENRRDFHEQNPMAINGVRIPSLFPGEKVSTVSASRPYSGFAEFHRAFLRNFSAASGTSAEQISMDYSQTNYSSSRSSFLEASKTMYRRREDFGRDTARPIYVAHLEEQFDRKLLPLPRNAPDFLEARAAYSRCWWIGPGRGWVDPVAERQGAIMGLDAGLNTLERECAEQGLDYEEVLDQRSTERRMMEERGIPFPEWAVGAPVPRAMKAPDAQ